MSKYSSIAMLDGLLVHASADPYAGTIATNGKPIVSAQQGADNLHRGGYDWYFDQYGEADDGILTYGFWGSQAEFEGTYHKSTTIPDFYATSYTEPENFLPFSEAQIAATELAIGLWDDVMAVDFERAATAAESDLAYMNTIMSPAAGAGAFLPGQLNGLDDLIEFFYGIAEIGRLGGDVFVNRLETANFDPAVAGSYALQTLLHETGHALGLEHVGDYNASDDDDGDGEPDPITYLGDAFIFQDSHQYSLMSYFGSRETGAATYDFANLEYIYPATPMVHDILAIQDIYGVETTTRTGDTVYGFNSNTDRPEIYDFSINELPVLAIWDAGGNDTLDFSGWDSDSLIDLNEGAFSSGGGSGRPTLEMYRQVFEDPDATEADIDAYLALRNSPDGMLRDNISIAYGAQIENAIGGGGHDTISGNALDNVLTGNNGQDTIHGNDGVDTLRGGNGNDTLNGGTGNDQLESGHGDDVLNGGAGDDRLDSGRGFDLYVFDAAGTDTVVGYLRGEDFDLSAFDITDENVTILSNSVVIDLGADDLTILGTKGVTMGDMIFA